MANFTKADYINALQEKVGLSKQDCVSFMEAYAEITQEALSRGFHIQLRGAWVLKPITQKANIGRNMVTGELMRIPERTGIKFTPSVALLERVRQKNTVKKETDLSHPF